MRRRALLTVAALAALATTAASCLSPTLPLPPPVIEGITADPSGLWQIAGTCLAGARVTVFNTSTHHGVVVEDVALAGTFHVALAGTKCDQVAVSQELHLEYSSEATQSLEAYANGAFVDPAACH